VLYWGAYAYYRVRSFAEGARFVAAIAEVADDVGHFPDVDLRPDGVTFWPAALGYRSLGANEDVIDRHRRNPHVSFQQLKPPRPGRGRTHIDVSVPADKRA